MTDEVATRRQIERAKKAKAFIESDIWQELFEGLDESLTAVWNESKHDEVELREWVFDMKTCVKLLREEAERMIVTGESAEFKQLWEQGKAANG